MFNSGTSLYIVVCVGNSIDSNTWCMNCFVSCYTGDIGFSVLVACVTMNSYICVKHCVCQ